MKKILFVCLGNICRSAMAEYIFRWCATKEGVEGQFEVASAGTSNEEEGNPIYTLAKRKLAAHGIGSKSHIARQMNKGDYAYYDYIIAMEEKNVRAMSPFVGNDPYGKVSLLLDHTDPGNKDHYKRDIADPWYTRDFDVAWDDILAGCKALLDELKDTSAL